MKIIAVIIEPEVARRILDCFGFPPELRPFVRQDTQDEKHSLGPLFPETDSRSAPASVFHRRFSWGRPTSGASAARHILLDPLVLT